MHRNALLRMIVLLFCSRSIQVYSWSNTCYWMTYYEPFLSQLNKQKMNPKNISMGRYRHLSFEWYHKKQIRIIRYFVEELFGPQYVWPYCQNDDTAALTARRCASEVWRWRFARRVGCDVSLPSAGLPGLQTWTGFCASGWGDFQLAFLGVLMDTPKAVVVCVKGFFGCSLGYMDLADCLIPWP